MTPRRSLGKQIMALPERQSLSAHRAAKPPQLVNQTVTALFPAWPSQ
jgi:hypothetical protein